MAEDVTVLIANLGRSDLLLGCLKSLFDGAIGAASCRAIVGFNFPGDSDVPTILARAFPSVAQLRAPRKLGYCRAYNQLMLHATGRYALLLDDDVVLSPGSVEGMVRFMDEHPDVGIAGCRTVNPDGSYQKTTANMYSLKTELTNMFRQSAFWRDGVDELVREWRTVGWLNGHFLMVRAEVIKQVGMLDERYYTFMCEADWCLRISRAGWKVAYVPDVQVVHVGGEHSVLTPGSKSYKNIMRSHLNRYYFFRKNYGTIAQIAFRPIMSFGQLLRVPNYCRIWLLSPARREEAGPKIEAGWKILLAGLGPHPEKLPEDLRRESDVIEALQPYAPAT